MCTSILIGKDASDRGCTVIARNEDCKTGGTNKLIYPMREPLYASLNGCWTLGNGMKVDVPDKAYRYCSLPDADGINEKAADTDIGDHYFFEARGINEKGAAISATNSMGINEKAMLADSTVTHGIDESVITTLILPQIESALDGVELLGKYVEKYGASEANGICFSDADEVWYMEIGSGHHWIAVKVPDDSYLIVANSMRIHDVNLEDTDNIRYSKGIYEFVKNNKLLKDPDKKRFNFSEAFGFQESMTDPKNGLFYNVDRIWLAQHILNPNTKQPPEDMSHQYPLFMKPENKISLETVAKVLRADYRGTELEGKADRLIGTVRTVESHMIAINETCFKNTSPCINSVIWQTIGTPIYSGYLCIIPEITDIPEPYRSGTDKYDKNSVFWTNQLIAACCSSLGQEAADEIRKKAEETEEKYFQQYYELTENPKGDIKRALQDFSNQSLINNINETNDLCSKIVTAFVRAAKDIH